MTHFGMIIAGIALATGVLTQGSKDTTQDSAGTVGDANACASEIRPENSRPKILCPEHRPQPTSNNGDEAHRAADVAREAQRLYPLDPRD